ncbi:hypothetical protein VTN49DRAFT_2000 [Thermomyces lanuginosus]|uniref:uncharacterized protein n=1 Tax=Thermomyces lanuginosus TaxID=5541 RepID=UPI003742E48B
MAKGKKKKRAYPSLQDLLERPWCYYCERDFDDLKILISHQKAKHFKCERCGRRLNTAGGLSVHMSQVHKEQLTAVDNALPNRASLDIEIFGMEGVPEDIIQAHNQRVISRYQEEEAKRRAATGNPPPGSGGTPRKRPKLDISDLKRQLAEYKAKKAEKAAGGANGTATPAASGQATPATGGFGQPSQYPQAESQTTTAAAQTAGTAAAAQPYAYPPPYGAPNQPYPNAASPVYPGYPPAGAPFGSPPQLQPGQTPPPYGATPSPLPFAPPAGQPAPTTTPPPNMPGYAPRQGSLPAAPGLPSRPSFGAPPVNAQQPHHTPGQPAYTAQPGQPSMPFRETTTTSAATAAQISSSVDELVSGAARAAEEAAREAPQSPKPEPGGDEKKARKAKVRLVYSDNEISPEEKMARLPRYAYTPDRKGETALVDATMPAVARRTTNSGDVIDPAD